MQSISNLAKLLIPNAITFLRILVLPFVVFFLLEGNFWDVVLAWVLFLVGSVSDAFDGLIARKLGVTSKFGFVMDPIADKVLVLGTLFTLSAVEYLSIPVWTVVIILVRDVMVTVLKPVSDKLGFSIPTTFFAKAKTTIQFIGILIIFAYMMFVLRFVNSEPTFSFLEENLGLVSYIPFTVTFVTTAITLASGVDYIILFILGMRRRKKK